MRPPRALPAARNLAGEMCSTVIPRLGTALRVTAVQHVGTAAVSSFSRVVRLRHPGLYRALVKVNDGAHVSNYSAPILVR